MKKTVAQIDSLDGQAEERKRKRAEDKKEAAPKEKAAGAEKLAAEPAVEAPPKPAPPKPAPERLVKEDAAAAAPPAQKRTKQLAASDDEADEEGGATSAEAPAAAPVDTTRDIEATTGGTSTELAKKWKSALEAAMQDNNVVDEAAAAEALDALERLAMTLPLLMESGVGKVVNKLRKAQQPNLAERGRALTTRWKALLPS